VGLPRRDPNLLDTVAAYDDTPAFLRDINLDKDALTKAIIGTIGDIDSYQLPDAKGRTAFMRHLLGVSDEERQQRREQILATSNKDFHAFAEVLEAVCGPSARVVAVTSKNAADRANSDQPGFFEKMTTVM
jgi:presequence protease